ILELAAGECMSRQQEELITPWFIQLAIRNDNEFCQLLKHVMIIQGGVLPYVHPQLLKERSKK
ncbi:hypothetical protein BT96DRAFT_796145, partial [Gymnopus androsaceus JB14]